MPTPGELLGLLLPAVLAAAALAAVGAWRRWAWAMPLAVGAGFVVGFALIGVPRLPPRDGTDWLFWLAPAATALGVVDAVAGKKWGWCLGRSGGGGAFVIARPLTPHAAATAELYAVSAGAAVVAMLLCGGVRLVEERVHAWAVAAAWCAVLGAAGVVVMSSNLKIVGEHALLA